jgi:CheY-like chemotaxis protein
MSADVNAPYILIAEDNPDDRLLLKYAFRSAHLPNAFEFANDGSQAVARLQELAVSTDPARPKIDLLVLDIQMPNKNGLEVLEWVRSQPEYKMLSVVVMSGLRSPAAIERALALGAHSYLFKPGDFGELTKFIGCFNMLPAFKRELLTT